MAAPSDRPVRQAVDRARCLFLTGFQLPESDDGMSSDEEDVLDCELMAGSDENNESSDEEMVAATDKSRSPNQDQRASEHRYVERLFCILPTKYT